MSVYSEHALGYLSDEEFGQLVRWEEERDIPSPTEEMADIIDDILYDHFCCECEGNHCDDCPVNKAVEGAKSCL